MKIYTCTEFYNFKDEDYNLEIDFNLDMFEDEDELLELVEDSDSKIYSYDWSTGFHVKQKYVVAVRCNGQEINKSDWDDYL